MSGKIFKFRFLSITAGILFWIIISPVNAQDSLRSKFKSPPAAAKARTWWHWINGNVSKEGITADLEAMKRVGIQEAQIFNVDQGYPNGPATFLSAKWLEMFQFAASEAKRLHLELGFNNGAGWSSSGGPWITPANAMQTIVFSQTVIKGGHSIIQKLAQPPVKLNYYQDIAVIAFPTLKSDQKIDDLALKTLSGDAFKTHLYPSDKTVEAAAIIERSQIIDLTAKMSADGTLNWAVPAGQWTVLRFGHTPTGTENRPAGLGGKGLEVNKMSKQAIDAYWAGGIQPILDKLGPLTGSAVTDCLVDSYEVGCNNWTSGFREEFKKKRGYDLMAFFPTLAGYYVESGEVSERFLWDFRKTIGELIAANYYGYFSELCHKSELQFSVEPYGGPFDSFQAGAHGDIIMGEFWLGRKEFSGSAKLAASIAHLNGNTFVGAEAFSSIGGWRNHPATMKQTGDYFWTEGLNRLIFHTYAHQPWNKVPGVTFHMYGVEMSRLNTWWEQSRAYMNYLARSQALLQSGKSFADILVFTGESSPNDGDLRPDIKSLGYDYDQIGAAELMRLTAKDGKIYNRNGLSYRLLVMPESRWATPELLLKIRSLTLGGAVVQGVQPEKSPSLTGYPASDMQVEKMAAEIWKNRSMPAGSIAEVLKQLNVPPDFSGGTTGKDLNFIHRVSGDDDIYLVASPKAESRDEICRFRITGKKPEFWDAETGTTSDVLVWKTRADNTTQIPIHFNAHGAVFIVFRKVKSLPQHIITAKTVLEAPVLKPLLDLHVIKAEYGSYLPDGLIDVTTVVAERIRKNGLHFSADNGLTAADPASGLVKELRVEYESAGKIYQFSLNENEQKDLTSLHEKFTLLRAVYGKFPPEYKTLPPKPVVKDVTRTLNGLLKSSHFKFTVNDSLFGVSGAKTIKNELRLVYSAEGETLDLAVPQGEVLHLESDTPQPRLAYENGLPYWITPYAGKIEYTIGNAVKKAEIKVVPKAIELSGTWEVSFPKDLGAPPKATFEKLISWPSSSDEGIRYFSGTAVYKKQFTLPDQVFDKDNSIELDLGSVRVIAEVILNGKNLGVLWKAPFRIELKDAVRKGENQLEVRITNLWTNRLIGDARYPEDTPGKYGIPESWPAWLSDTTVKRNSNRITFSTWKHWDENSPLQSSGLLGPVILRTYKHVRLP